jgi:two-component system, chemotaxis family, protein-glutamate methylesterase/glutaminase
MNFSVTIEPVRRSVRQSAQAPLRVMVVDDSVVIRGTIGRWLAAESDISVVASPSTGREAVDQLLRANPEIIVLDIDMPDLDGLAALPLLLRLKPDTVVVMASALTRRNAEISLKALSLGATDYVPKPESALGPVGADQFRRELVDKIRALGQASRARLLRRNPSVKISRQRAAGFVTRPAASARPNALVIGASTGGPQALLALFAQLRPIIARYPVLVAQHMPPTFTALLAENLARISGFPAAEAIDGEAVVGGRIYVAPGGKHLRIARRRGAAVIALDTNVTVHYCRPAVDPLFESAAQVWRHHVAALVLTGMGSDGLQGARTVADAGGSVIAQDETTSVIWGMPGAVAHAGICTAVLPINQIAARLIQLFSGDRF